MHLSEFRIYNYKSFTDSGPISFKPGINILTGQNNAGKTALLEALSLHFQNKQHRGLTETTTAALSAAQHLSTAFFRISLTQSELKSYISQSDTSTIPISPSEFTPAQETEHPTTKAERVLNDITSRKELQLDSTYNSTNKNKIHSAHSVKTNNTDNQGNYQLLTINEQSSPRIILWNPSGPQPPIYTEYKPATAGVRLLSNTYGDISDLVSNKFHSNIYNFRAERMNIGVSSFGSETHLQSDARNLPEVLHVLQSTNPARFQRYNKLVRRVFSQVEWVSVRPVNNQQVEILIWPVSPETEREDLAIPLTESGTGISQVLAMLYILVTAQSPRTILIDELNSFLHPGAVRVLVEILRENPQHQYILSTHSPELIAASNPSTIHILRREQGVTRIESVNAQEARHFRSLLMDVGSRPSDVFGAENVLWAEGPTEQLCFPLIARHFLRRPLAGVSIVGVLHTGDFDAKKDIRSIFRIYERLTQESALLPLAIAFIFDREIRPDKDRQDLERQGKGKVHFLSRRTYENYLLHAGALASVMNEYPPFTETPTTAEQVQSWLDENCRKTEYYGKAKTQDYPQDIDAPKFLDALFGELSENRLTYNKVEHSHDLTEWLLQHAPEELKEIGDLLDKVLPA